VVQGSESARVKEKLHNVCTALNVIEIVRPSMEEHRVIDLNDWHVWKYPCASSRNKSW